MERHVAVDVPPVQIIGVGNQGLTLIQGKRQWCEPWTAVKDVVVGRVPFGPSTMVIAGIGFLRRSIFACADQPVWDDLMKMMHQALPISEPYEVWSCRPEIATGPYVIYTR